MSGPTPSAVQVSPPAIRQVVSSRITAEHKLIQELERKVESWQRKVRLLSGQTLAPAATHLRTRCAGGAAQEQAGGTREEHRATVLCSQAQGSKAGGEAARTERTKAAENRTLKARPSSPWRRHAPAPLQANAGLRSLWRLHRPPL